VLIGEYPGLGYPIDGKIGEFRIYDRPVIPLEATNLLNDAEVASP
jgi:hypothetical protein